MRVQSTSASVLTMGKQSQVSSEVIRVKEDFMVHYLFNAKLALIRVKRARLFFNFEIPREK